MTCDREFAFMFSSSGNRAMIRTAKELYILYYSPESCVEVFSCYD